MSAPEPVLDRARFLAVGGALVVAFALPGCAPGRNAGGSGTSEANPMGAKVSPAVDAWLALGADGAVTVFFGKVELGTGVETSLAQLVADELYVPFARVRVVQADTARTQNQGYTAGSQTLTSGATPVRHAAAEARLVLLGLGARHLGVGPDRVETRDGAVAVRGEPARRVSYGALIGGRRFERTMETKPTLRAPATYEAIGKPIPRVDIPAKVSGSFAYAQNLRVPGMRHARVVLPPAPGAVLHDYDAASLAGIPEPIRIVRRGDFLAVVATKEWHAVRAAQELRVTWDGGTKLPATNAVADAVRKAGGKDRALRADDVDAVFGGAKRTLSATYTWPFQSHASIGPSAAVADVRADGATVWSGTQGVFPLRGALAELLGLPAERVRAIYVEASGCYGHNGADDAAAAAALVSQAVHAPVRVQYSRQDEHGWDPKGPAMVMEVRGALDDAGTIAAWDYHVWTPTHNARPDGHAANLLPGQLAHLPPAPVTYVGGDRNAPNNYAIPKQRITITDQPAAVLRQSALRGLGGTQNTFANESFVDELAHLAGADPLEFRLRHLRDERSRAVLQALRGDYERGRGVAFVHYENTEARVAAVVDCRVDHKTGVVRLDHVWIAHDCGLVVNPDGLRNQIEGNVLQAASRALKEEVTLADGRVTSIDWVGYPILTFAEVPDVTIRLLDRPNEKIVGAGEATTTVIAPAIANAIFARTGVRLRGAPFTPQAVLTALGQALPS